jgi:hypothetical protein
MTGYGKNEKNKKRWKPKPDAGCKALDKTGGGVEYRYNVFIRLADVRNIKGEVPGLFT